MLLRPTFRLATSRIGLFLFITWLAFALRMYSLTRDPLRGDEAFTVRYQTVAPNIYFGTDGLGWKEIQPMGYYFLVWAWKSLAGNSEFAMRTLSVLLGLLAIPAMDALTYRLTKDRRIGLVAALLTAINPHLIWHAQDIRFYSMWVGLSTVALWLLLRVTDPALRPTRWEWGLYILTTVLALYVMFLEVFIVLVHALIVLLFRRHRLRQWLMSLVVIGILLIPWALHGWALLHSGYRGTAVKADASLALGEFPAYMLYGETTPTTSLALFGLWLLSWPLFWREQRGAAWLMIILLVVPLLCLALIALRIDVFRPRYIIAQTLAYLLPLAVVIASRRVDWRRWLGLLSVITMFILTGLSLLTYWTTYHKSPDWYALRDYFRSYASSADVVLMASSDPRTGYVDPSFAYYVDKPLIALPHPQFDTVQTIQQTLAQYRAVWFVVVGDTSQLNAALNANGVMLTDRGVGRSFLVRQYRGLIVKPSEIEHPLTIDLGGGQLGGYSLTGDTTSGGTLVLLLYWTKPPAAGLTTFVHLIGSPHADGSPLWATGDHPPLQQAGRDSYAINLQAVSAGTYQLEIGLYNPLSGQRVVVNAQGDQSIKLGEVTITVAP